MQFIVGFYVSLQILMSVKNIMVVIIHVLILRDLTTVAVMWDLS